MRRVVWPALLPTLVLLGLVQGVRAEDSAPYKIDASNWQRADGLVPDTVLKRLKNGDYQFDVVPLEADRFRANYSQAYWAASEANEGKYDVDPETCGLKRKGTTNEIPDHVFGRPFPKIDPKDPFAGCKIAWNFYVASQMGEGQGATFTLNGLDRNGEYRRVKMWLHLESYLGRHQAIDNPEKLRFVSLSHALEPADAEGVNFLSQQTNDWESAEKIWAYLPEARRVRRLNAATRSDPIGGIDLFSDDLNCYSGKVEYYEWTLVGEGEVLAPVIGPYALPMEKESETRYHVEIPYLQGAYETPGAKGAPWGITKNLVFVKRPVWIVEGKSNDPYYNFGKVIMYFDKEMDRIYWKKVHNKAGEYFYTAMCGYHFSKRADGQFSAVTPNMVMGVNDKTDSAALGGRYQSQFIERHYDPNYFSLRSLSRLGN